MGGALPSCFAVLAASGVRSRLSHVYGTLVYLEVSVPVAWKLLPLGNGGKRTMPDCLYAVETYGGIAQMGVPMH